MYRIVGLGWHRRRETLCANWGWRCGWQQRCNICRSLRELNNQGTVFCFVLFLVVTVMVVELGHVVGDGEL